MKMTFLTIMVLILLLSCTSTPKSSIDIGVFNPENFPEEELATLIIHSYIRVQQVNNTNVTWSGDKNRRLNQIVRIPSGLHTFQVTYHDGRRFTLVPMPVGALFEKRNTYFLSSTEVEREVEIYGHTIVQKQAEFHIHLFNEGIKGEKVSIDPNNLQQTELTAQLAYRQFIHEPIFREGKSILLLNEDYFLLLRPDNVFSFRDNKKGITTEGRYIYPTGRRAVSGKIFLYEVDIDLMTREEFMSTNNIRNYVENSQMVLVPIKCTSNEIVLRFERPTELEGNERLFFIRHLNQ